MSSHCAKAYISSAGWVEFNALLAALVAAAAAPAAELMRPVTDFIGFSVLFQLCLGLMWLSERLFMLLPKPHSAGAAMIRRGTALITALAGCGALLPMLKSHLPGTVGDGTPAALLTLCLLAVLPAVWPRLKNHGGTPHPVPLLERRIRYHFLFNALNTVTCLIPERPETAADNLAALTHLFRKLVRQQAVTTLHDEIDTVKQYLSVERARLGARLNVAWSLPEPGARRTAMPSLLLQPLIENAVYHGIESCPDGGLIQIRITACRRFLHFEIRNPIGNAPTSADGTNSATQTTHARLRRLFNAEYEFFVHRTNGEYSVHLKIPRQEVPHHECSYC